MTKPPNDPLLDAAAREAIRNDLDVTMLVEAAAGTGKTTSLVGRMLNIVRSGRATVSTLAAITFTVKAAAQLRERLQEALEQAAKNAATNDEASRFRAALADIDRGFIGTTHAFCARLLRERPVEAELDPEFEESGDADASGAMTEFWSDWYEAEASRGNASIDKAREVGLDSAALRPAFERLVQYPDVVMVSTPTVRPDLHVACDAVCELLAAIQPNMPTDQHRSEPDDFEKMIVNLLRLRKGLTADDFIAQAEFLDEADHGSRKPTQRNWPDGKAAKQFGLDWVTLVTTTIKPALLRWREHVHGIAIPLVREAAQAFEADRRRKGTLTYQDLLTCARDMLMKHAHVRSYFQKRFTHLLVDEFQDTDPLQAEILFYLTGEDVTEPNWRNLTPRPGSLFIVGDPKQSIYRFRRADITTYLGVKEQIASADGRVEALSTNFRSVPAICDFVNRAFPAIFTADDVAAGRQAPHVDLTPFRPDPAVSGVYSLQTPKGNVAVMAETEARTIAGWIRRAVDSGMMIEVEGTQRPIRWSDVMLVSWQKPRLAFYAAALEENGIPYEITGSKAFAQSHALKSAMPLLRAVVDPDDVLSIVGFLRGALCGVDDDALYRHVRAKGSFNPFAELPEGADERIARGLSIVREAVEDARTRPPSAVLARLFDRIGLTALAAAGIRSGTATGNLMLALAIARHASANGDSLAGIVDRFAELLETKPDIGELDIDPSRADAVRLMNLHQVKGLEAPVVFLIDPSEGHEFAIDLYVDRVGDESRGFVALTRDIGHSNKKDVAVPLDWESKKAIEATFVEAERKRLLYVAVTRAKNVLVIAYHNSNKGISGAWKELASLAKNRIFEPGAAPPQAQAAAAPREPFAEAVASIATKVGAARNESYSVLPITKVAHASHAELVRAEEGRGKGTSWGRVMHRLLEALLRNETLDVRLHASNLLKDEERDAAELDEVLRTVEAVRSSPLWQRVKSADERHMEVPFALEVQQKEVGLDGDGKSLLHGTIDLVFRENGRWFIVDYKSDSTAGRIESLVKYYAPQVQLYARFWSRITGQPAEGGLFFVDGCVERWIPGVRAEA